MTAVQELGNRTDSDDIGFPLRIQLAMDTLFWITLYLVKASFLALMWCIFKVSAGFRKAWWTVAIYTFVTFWIIFLSRFWQCGSPSTYDNPQACDLDSLLQEQKAEIFIAFTFHISSDLPILILPIAQIRKLSMPVGRKISVAAVFAIVIIDTAISVARNVATIIAALSSPTDASANVDIICGVIEPALAVLVCSLPPYKALVFKLRPRRSDNPGLRQPPVVGGRWWNSEKLSQLISIPGPLLEVSILQEQPSQTTERSSEFARSLLDAKSAHRSSI